MSKISIALSLAMREITVPMAPLREWISQLQFPPLGTTSEVQKTLWLTKFRWLALGFSLILLQPAMATGRLSLRYVFPYLIVVSFAALFNWLTATVWSKPGPDVGPTFIGFQLSFDLLILATLLFFTGGIQNPALPLLYLHVGLGALLIRGPFSISYLALTHLILFVLQLEALPITEVTFISVEPMVSPSSMLMSHLLVLCFWTVARSLGAQFEKNEAARTSARIKDERTSRLRAIGALAAGLSHEFASPLQAARLRVERAYRKVPESQTDLAEALKALDSCSAVVHSMNASQFDSARHPFRVVHLDDLVRDIVESWREDHPETNVELKLASHAVVEIPPMSLAQSMINILDNALESGSPGGITVLSFRQDRSAVLEVLDRGPGFSEAFKQHEGEPFYTTKTQGTGLGLYVAGLFSHSVGGEIVTENRSDGGARVALEIPINGAGIR